MTVCLEYRTKGHWTGHQPPVMLASVQWSFFIRLSRN